MKKLSLNIKKIALSLLVVGLAVGTQAFKNAEKVNDVTTYYYKLNSSGTTYTFMNSGTIPPSSVNCTSGIVDKCIVGFEEDQGAAFSRLPAPSDPRTYQSASNGYLP